MTLAGVELQTLVSEFDVLTAEPNPCARPSRFDRDDTYDEAVILKDINQYGQTA